MRGYWNGVAVLLVAGAVQPCGAVAQTGFNGVITFRSENGKSTLIQTTKGHKLRLDGFGGDSGSMIVDNDAKVMMMVDPGKKQYMTMTEADMKQMQAMMGPMMEKMKQQHGRGADGKFDFAKTGRAEKVAGVPCEVWHGSYTDGTGEKKEGEACVATGVGFALADLTFNNPMLQQRGAGRDWMEQYRRVVGGNKGILKATSIKNGTATVDLEATKIEPKDVSDAAFAPPPGYKEIRLGDMMMQAHDAMEKHQKGQGKPQQ